MDHAQLPVQLAFSAPRGGDRAEGRLWGLDRGLGGEHSSLPLESKKGGKKPRKRLGTEKGRGIHPGSLARSST